MYTTIGRTKKGARLWIQGLRDKGITGSRFSVIYYNTTAAFVFTSQGKRKVTEAKGGVASVESARVAQWAGQATQASVFVDAENQTVFISKAGE